LKEDEIRYQDTGRDAYHFMPINFRKCVEIMREMINKQGVG
jgi:hypothetical protein